MKTLLKILNEALDLQQFASEVKTVGRPVAQLDDAAFVSDVYEAKDWGMPIEQFKKDLLLANKQRLLNLRRCDMSNLFPPQLIAKSLINAGVGNETFHLIVVK